MKATSSVIISAILLLAIGCNKESEGSGETISTQSEYDISKAKEQIRALLPSFVSSEAIQIEVNEIEELIVFSFKATVSAKEDLYAISDSGAVEPKLKELGWDRSQATRAEIPNFAELGVVTPQGEMGTIYGKLIAEPVIDGWLHKDVQFQSGTERIGQPIGAYDLRYISINEPRSMKVLEDFAAKQKMRLERERIEKEKENERLAFIAAQKEELRLKVLDTFSPGSKFFGTYTWIAGNAEIIEKIMLEIHKLELDGDLLNFTIRSVNSPDQLATYTGRVVESTKGTYFVSAKINSTSGVSHAKRGKWEWAYAVKDEMIDCKSLSVDFENKKVYMVCQSGQMGFNAP